VERQYTVVKTPAATRLSLAHAFGAAYGPAVARSEGDEGGYGDDT
jgi:hypothetical protein